MKQIEIKLGPLPMQGMRRPTVSATTAQESIDAVWCHRMPKNSVGDFSVGQGCSKGEMSKRLSYRFANAINDLLNFERNAHCLAVTEYMAYAQGYSLVPRQATEDEKRDREIRELRQRIYELEGGEIGEEKTQKRA